MTKAYNIKSLNYIFLRSIQFNNYSTKESVLDTAYIPKNVEKSKINYISKCDSFKDNSKIFSMILPPPNITGLMHLGHCLTATIQDVIVRTKRKNGYDVKWIPGTDHAGIATQVVVEKILKKEMNKNRYEIGRENFIEAIWNWKTVKRNQTKDDLLRLGTTLDWKYEYFTMDPDHSFSVKEAFIRLFDKGLIYRSNALINWSCSLGSAISDIEVENVEITGPTDVFIPSYERLIKFGQLYDIIYKTTDGNDIVVSTTRPETILGDVAVAVNTNDKRYSKYLEDKTYLVHPFRKKSIIPLIGDDTVNPEFGSGAIKITPGHDKTDFEIAKRHNLPIISIMNEKGKITESFEPFSGQPRFDARFSILENLARRGLLKQIRPHKMTLPVCSRSKDIVEMMIRPQWFLKCEEMSRKALEALKYGDIKVHPISYLREWEYWMSNCKDWCISRQIWWGHRVPAWKIYEQNNSSFRWIAAHNQNEAKIRANNYTSKIKQDEDVLDTWFSSALLPFSINGWPKQSVSKFYPLHLMETGHDILFFWVARMTMLAIELTNQVPFKELLLHGIICDAFGRKMSKSLGNIITPNQIIYGTSLLDLHKETKRNLDTGVLSYDEYEKSVKGQKKMFPNGIPECGN